MAPAWNLPAELRTQLHSYATRLTSAAKYKNAGTVEFLVDAENRAYFIEVNPRIQASRRNGARPQRQPAAPARSARSPQRPPAAPAEAPAAP